MPDPKFVYLNVTKQSFDWMVALFREGKSANAVQKFTSDLGLNKGKGFRRSTVQGVRLKALSMFKHEYAWDKLGKTMMPNKTYFNELNYKAPFKYWCHYDTEGVDPLTGATKKYTLSAFSDYVMSKDQWTDEILSQLNPEYYKNVEFFQNVAIRSVDHKVGSGY